MNETRRIALEFAMRCQPINGFGLIRLALQIEAFLTNDDKSLLELFGGNDPGVAEAAEARP